MDATTPTGDAAGRPVRRRIDGPGFNHLIEGRQGYVCPAARASRSASFAGMIRSTGSAAAVRRLARAN